MNIKENAGARPRTKRWMFIALLTMLVLIAAACGDDSEVTATTNDPETTVPIPTIPGTTTEAPADDLSQPPDDGRDGVVNIGTGPSYDDRLFGYADSIGIPEKLGLTFELIPFTSIPFQPLARGDIDWLYACQFCYTRTLEEFPSYRTPLITNHYKGFVVIGRTGDLTYEQALADNNGDKEAALEDLAEWVRGKEIPRPEGDSTAPIQVFLDSLGLTLDDIEIPRPADRQSLANAFIRGEYDLYLGNLPNQSRMLYAEELEGQFVVVAPLELFGGRALWYSTEGTTQEYLDCCYESLLRTVAVWYRAARYLDEMPDIVAEYVAEAAIASTGGENLGNLVTRDLLTELNHHFTLEAAADFLYDPDAPTYFGIPGESAFSAFPDLDWREFEVEDKVFQDLMAREDLVAFINRPLGSGIGPNGDDS